MEYIQCSHCQKKYSVNDSIRAAAGKKIRCKGCDQTFEIVVLGGEKSDVPPAQEKIVVESPVAAEKAPVAKPQAVRSPPGRRKKPKQSLENRVKEKRNSRFTMIVIFLGLLLLLAMGALAYLYVEKPELFQSWSKKMYMEEEQPLAVFAPAKEAASEQLGPQLPAPLAKALSQSSTTPNGNMMGPTLPADIAGPSPAAGPPLPEPKESTYRDMVQESKACSESAAQQWMVDYLISHMTYSGADYIQMLDQSSEHSASMRENCKDHALIHEITAAAREGKKPFWIQAAVDAMQKQQLDATTGSTY